jgi:hypothetical protein
MVGPCLQASPAKAKRLYRDKYSSLLLRRVIDAKSLIAWTQDNKLNNNYQLATTIEIGLSYK